MSSKKFIKTKSLKKNKYLSGTKGVNDGFSDLVPGNTTQYAPDEKFFTDNNSPASANNNTVGWSGKTGEIQNKTISPKKVSVNKPPTNYSIPNNRDFPNSYNRFDNFSNSFNDDFNEDMFWRPRQSPIEQMRNQQNYAGRNYTRFKFKSGIFNRPSFEQNSYQRTKHDVEYLTPRTPKFSFEQSKENSSVKPLSVESTPTSESAVKPKSGFAQYPNMKQGFFNRMADKIGGLFQNRTVNSRSVNNISATGPTFVSGVKSVKQYRGDENLPEAKNGMKNCGCKHPKKKYKYQFGGEDILADKLEFGESGRPRKNVDIDESNLDLSMYDLPETKVVQPSRTIVTPNKVKRDTSSIKRKAVVPKKDTVIVSEKRTYPTVSGEKKVYIEKSPVSRKDKEVNNNDPYSLRNKYTDRVKKYVGNYDYTQFIPQRDTVRQLVDGKMIITPPSKKRWGKENLGYDYENLSPEEQNQVRHEFKLRRAEELKKEIDLNNKNINNRSSNTFSAHLARGKAIQQERNNMLENIKKMGNPNTYRRGYKYGTGALAIPEGSAIVTANGSKNKQALMAYKNGNYKLLNKIIDQMPEDNVDKAQEGKKKLKSSSALNYVPANQHKEKYYGKVTDADFDKLRANNPWYDWSKFDPSREGDVKKFQEAFNKLSESLGSSARLSVDDKLGEQTATAKVDYMGEQPTTPPGQIPPPTPPDETPVKKGKFNVPAMAEIAARGSILSQGIENVPENYLKLGRYQYASQLPKTLQEIQLAEQSSRESARDIVGGDAGRYLAQAGSLSSSRMKAANEAVIQDTLARQDILNKNVDLGNTEAQVNTGLKNQYNELRGKARSAYNDQLVGLGQRIDSATETAQEMANQRSADDQRMQILKDLGLNYEYKNVDGLMKLVPKVPANTPPAATTTTTTTTATPDATGKKGLKRLKTYKKK